MIVEVNIECVCGVTFGDEDNGHEMMGVGKVDGDVFASGEWRMDHGQPCVG